MEEIIAKLPGYLEQASIYLSVLTAVATALVRLPVMAKYEKQVGGAVGFIRKVLSWLPTLGVNPRTKELEKKATP